MQTSMQKMIRFWVQNMTSNHSFLKQDKRCLRAQFKRRVASTGIPQDQTLQLIPYSIFGQTIEI